MRKFLLLLFASSIHFSAIKSQSTGDYRSTANGNWTDAATWQRFNGVLWVAAPSSPVLSDGVITVTHVITLTSNVDADQLVIASGGTIQGSSSLNITGSGNNWTGGTLDAPTTITGTLTLPNNDNVTLNDVLTLQNGANIIWNAGTMIFNSGTVNNNGTITLNNALTSSFAANTGTNAVNNNSGGMIIKSNGAGDFSSTVSLNNAGTITINTGSYTQAGNTLTNTSTINIATGTVFNSNSTSHFNTGTIIAGDGTLSLASGAQNINLALSTPSTLTLDFINGNLQGSGSLTIDGNMNWNGGAINLPLVISNAAKLTLNGNVTLNHILTIQQTGDFDWIAGTMLFNDGLISNNGTITLFNTLACSFAANTGTNTVNNSSTGRITKFSGAGAFSSTVNVINSGIFEINTSSFTQSGGTFTNTYAIEIDAATSFINNSTINFNNGTDISGEGILSLGGGTHNVNLALTIPSTVTVNLINGNLQGSGSLTINGEMNWSGGTLNLSTGIAGTLNLNGNVTLSDVITVQQPANFNWVEGSIVFNDGTIHNNGIITLFNTLAVSFAANTGTNAVNNSSTGKITKFSGAGAFSSTVNITNAGIFEISNSSFTQSGGIFTNTYAIEIDAGASFVNNATINFNTGTLISGEGTLSLSGSAHNVNLALSIQASITVNFIGGNMQGSGSLTINGIINWSGGTLNLPLNIANAASLVLSNNVTLSDILTILTGGNLFWNAGVMLFNGGSVNNNSNIILNNAAAASFTANTGINAVNNNYNALISNSGAGGFSSTVNITNAGMINGIGAYNFIAGFINTGVISPGLSPGILTMNGSAPFGANSTLNIEIMNGNGPGTGHDQLQRNSNLVLDGTLNVIQTGTVPLGTYTIINLTSGTISGSFDLINLQPGYSFGQTSNTFFVTKNADILWKFRSKQSGDWYQLSTWETSVDGLNWTTATQLPSLYNAEIITILGPHIVNLSTNTTVKKVDVESGATLNVMAGILWITN